ncbi:MAG: hypothetical protein J6T98_05915 [Salinivirgaceae bacterium]|nr:hypothetical protein [Salinivirgaceae bacterium]
MRVRLLLALSFLLLLSTEVSARGGIPLLFEYGDHVIKVLDLPERDEFMIQPTHVKNAKLYYADLGIQHERISIFGIPLFNYGEEQYVLYTDVKIGDYDYTAASLSYDDIDAIREEFPEVSEFPELPFWDEFGGKILLAAIAWLIWYLKWGKNED